MTAPLEVADWHLPLSPDGVVLNCRDGGRIRVRPIRKSDKQALIETFRSLSPESRRRRFFTQMNELPEYWANRLTDIDHRGHRAWVVFDAESEAGQEVGIAVARMVAVDGEPGTAELSLVVADDQQGRGIGRMLMDLLLSTAAVSGVRVLRADTMYDNKAMIRLMRERGAERVDDRTDPGIVSFDLAVPDVDETTGALYDLIRLAA